MQEKINLAIIGGGASGLIAAITASKICKQTKQITIFEGASRVGKKLLATGNGRCNLTNIHASAKHYYGDTRLIEAILRTYPPQRVIQYFEEIGLLCKEESEGRIYPYSLQASSVLDVLRFNAEELQVEIICDCPIHNIQSKNGIFILENHQQQTFIADKVILATGGKASPQLGSAGNGYTLAKQLGHTVTPLYPALTILKTPPEYVKSLKGMRSHVTATLKCNGKAIRHEKGEVQFTEQGLSGICMFQFSRHVAHSIANKQKITILLDLLMCDKEAIEVQKILPFLSDTWPLCRIGRAVIRASQSCRQSCNKSQCPACGCRSHHSCTHAPQFSRSFPAREWGSVLQRQGACGQCP